MSKCNHDKIIPRYSAFVFVFAMAAMLVVGRTINIMTVEKPYWDTVATKQTFHNRRIPAERGRIFSCDGQLMSATLPQFALAMDFRTMMQNVSDSLWQAKLDSICNGLHDIFPSRSAAEFRALLEEGKKQRRAYCPIWDKKVDYNTYTQVRQLPILKMSAYKGGFVAKKDSAREQPFGSLALRTIGSFNSLDRPYCGLEKSMDSTLRGIDGKGTSLKVLNSYISQPEVPAINGADIITTIDVQMQDLAERALTKKLQEIGAYTGVAIVMEVQTGDIKAIVNMEQCKDGKYREVQSHAAADLLEPGSVFKTASVMVAIDDGAVDSSYVVDTGNGTWNMYGRQMRDANWRSGNGGGPMTLATAMRKSSNVGISRIIDLHYHDKPEQFVQGIYDLGLHDDLNLPIPGMAHSRIRMPQRNKRGKFTNWSATALPWMSIGYETQLTPLQTLTFYNTIANGGKMVRPRLVKQIIKDGQVIEDKPVEVMREQVAKPSTIQMVTRILETVVSRGTGKRARSDLFSIAGKTGTAQVAKEGGGGYTAGGTNYLVSFAGFFPSNAPRYSCIVCIRKNGAPASGGLMSGPVFKEIAEGIMSQYVKVDLSGALDTSSTLLPIVKNGNLLAADYALNFLGFNVLNGWGGAYPFGQPIWGTVTEDKQKFAINKQRPTAKNIVPDVHGLGARDAVYQLESRGLKVVLKGRGKVLTQSIGAGDKVTQGMVCTLTLG